MQASVPFVLLRRFFRASPISRRFFERVKEQCDLFWAGKPVTCEAVLRRRLWIISQKNVLTLCRFMMKSYNKHNRSYFKALEEKAEEMARKYDCPFVDNEMPYGRVPQGHPVIVDYFYR